MYVLNTYTYDSNEYKAVPVEMATGKTVRTHAEVYTTTTFNVNPLSSPARRPCSKQSTNAFVFHNPVSTTKFSHSTYYNTIAFVKRSHHERIHRWARDPKTLHGVLIFLFEPFPAFLEFSKSVTSLIINYQLHRHSAYTQQC